MGRQAWHPLDLPEGYHATTPGAELHEINRRERRGLHPRTPRGRALPGRGDATQLSALGERVGRVAGAVDPPSAGE